MIPTPESYGWKLQNGKLQFDRFKWDSLPQELTDVVENIDPQNFKEIDVEDEPEFENLCDTLYEDDEEQF